MATVYLSLGSNVDREASINACLTSLHKAFGSIELSSLFDSSSVGFEGTDFYNMVVKVETTMPLEALVVFLREMEYAHGREPDAKKFSPRTIDIDLLLYDDVVCDSPAQLPRDEIAFNAFVLWPLSELAPDKKHPVNGKTYGDMWAAFDKSSQQLTKIPLTWTVPKEVKHL